MTVNPNKHLETLSEIRSLMERSSRFISLSGLSGISAGVCALVGATIVYIFFDIYPFQGNRIYALGDGQSIKWGMTALEFMATTGTLVLLAAIWSAIFFTTRKARRKGQKIWDPLTQRLLLNLAIPLGTGGIFCIALVTYNDWYLVAPATLIFYGLGLVNASKYTLHDIRYLGISEIGLGLIAAFFPGYGLEFWAIGFGILHILYGSLMYFKYERQVAAQ